MIRECPKCGGENRDATYSTTETCPKCGVIYAKAVGARNAAIDRRSARLERSPLSRERILIGVVAVAFFAYLLIPSCTRDKTGIELGVEQPVRRGGAVDVEARSACAANIERSAKWSSRWTDSVFGEEKFSVNTVTGNEVHLAGSQLEMQNAFGAWRRMKYACVYYVETKKTVSHVEPLNP